MGTTFSPPTYTINSYLSIEDSLSTTLKFWEVEELPVMQYNSPDDVLCEKIYSRTTFRDNTGRYIVELPFKQSPASSFVGTRDFALQRLLPIERRLDKNPTLGEQYRNFMSEYLNKGFMTKIEASMTDSGLSYYIPHHCVVRPDRRTTKLRVVFDASMKDEIAFH